MERCLKKLVLEAETKGFQDPARTARSPQREELCGKGLVGSQWLYIHESRRAKKLIPLGVDDPHSTRSRSQVLLGLLSKFLGRVGRGGDFDGEFRGPGNVLVQR